MFDVEKIRADFPLLSTEVYGRPLVYLDSGATAQKPRCVIDTVDYLHRELNANIHRGVHRLAEEATERYEAARDRIRAFIGAAHREEVIFTAGATASLNTVAYAWGDTFLRAGDNIVVSEMEHHSNLVPWQAVALRKGAELRMLPFDDAGRLMTERLDGLIDGRTRMVAVTQASNTLGTRPDLRPIVEAAHAVGALVCVDGCQGIVHGGADVAALGYDFYAFSGHKLYGPTGIGVLYGRRELLDAMASDDAEAIEHEFGDHMFTLVELGRRKGIKAAPALNAATERFLTRFERMEALARERNLDFVSLSLDDKDDLWNEVKAAEKPGTEKTED